MIKARTALCAPTGVLSVSTLRYPIPFFFPFPFPFFFTTGTWVRGREVLRAFLLHMNMQG